MKKLALVVASFSLGCALSAASVFEITDGQSLKIRKDGSPFLLTEKTSPVTILTDIQKSTAPDGSLVYNGFDKRETYPFRREISLSADRKSFDICFQGITHAYEKQPAVISYTTEFDVRDFAGGTWYSVTGRTNAPIENTGKIPAVGSPEYARGMRFGSGAARVVILTSADQKKNLIFDFNVEGVTTYSDYGANSVRGTWNPFLQNGVFTCGVGFNQGIHGGILNSILRVYEGDKALWQKNHAMSAYHYARPIPCQGDFAFGAADQKVGRNFRKINALYSKENKAGWLNKVPAVKSIGPSGSLYTAAVGKEPAVFQVSDVKPGIYLVTMRSVAYDKSVKNFSVAVNGTEYVKNAGIPANHVAVIRRFVHLDETTKFEFSGDWTISTLVFQAIMTDYEDIRFRRGFWKMVGLWEPTNFLNSLYYARPLDYKTDIALIPLVPYGYQIPANYRLAMKTESCRPADSDELEWRYNSNITGLGPGVNGNFTEFDTREKIVRRMDELQKEGTTTVLVNGQLARHLFPSHAPYVDNVMRMFSEEAHKRGMKLLDHQEYALLWGMGEGARVAVNRPNAMTQSLVNSSGALCYCVCNEEYTKLYRSEVMREIKVRNLDGMMIDEVAFLAGEDFCGCADCRRKFTQDTGLLLPMDETSPLLDKNSVLHHVFDQWRMKVVGDFFVNLRKEINKVQPNFSLMLYTTHYGWYSDYASVRMGGTLENPARAVDFLGTEIMSRNVIVSRRPVYAFRKMKNSLANWNKTPLFGLVYPQENYEISEFGWALNNLANQSTWFIAAVPPPMTNGKSFISFPIRYNRRFCKPAGRIAILWSSRCRDYARNCSYYAEPLGMGELLNDLGIQYEYVLEQELENLKDYSALMVLNAHILSDQQVSQIRAFAERGGLVYLSGNVGAYTELVEPRRKWPFADIFNGTLKFPVVSYKLRGYKGLFGEIPNEYYNTRFMALAGGLKGEILCCGEEKYPVVVKTSYGKGAFIYSSLQFGAMLKEDEKTVNDPFLGIANLPLLPLARRMLLQEFAPHSALRYENPDNELMSGLYLEKRPGQKGRLILHLLNGYGIQNPAVGTKIAGVPPIGIWSPLPQKVTFEISLSKEQQAQVGALEKAACYAPDYEGEKLLPLEKKSDGKWMLTVPAEAVPRYAVIIVE